MYDSFIRRDINGNFTLQVVTDYDGRIVESNEGNNAFLYNLALPTVFSDLYLYNITTSPSQSVTGGSQVRVTWSVRNIGNGMASGNWYDFLYIDTVPRVTQNNVTLSTVLISDALAPNDEYNQTVDIQISPTFSGNHFLVIQVDRYSGIFEDGFSENNILGYPILIVAPSSPDLTITSISYMISLSDTSQRILTVSWTVINIGDAMESITSWRDRVYLSRYREFNRNRVTTINTREVRNQQLSYNQEYSISSTTILRDNIVENYFIFVETDSSGNVFELNGEDNNIGRYSEEIEILPPPTPRLLVSIASANLPANLTSGSTITITYSVTNVGEVAVSLSSWTDQVYLVRTQDRTNRSTILSAGIPLGGNVNNRDLGVRETYEISLRVTPPYQLNQFMFLAVVVDINGNLGNPVTIGFNGQLHALSSRAYLVENGLLSELTIVPSLSSTAFFGGQPVTMNFSVSNTGQKSATGVWYDAIYLSRDAALDSFDTRFISVRNPTNLGVQESYNRSVQVFIPFNLGSNEYYIFFETDTGNRQLEINEHNNIAGVLISIEETVTTDLVVDRVSASPTDLRYGDSKL
jgi:subtilase family serine protease